MSGTDDQTPSPEPVRDDTSFLARAAHEGDVAALTPLYLKVAPALYAWAALRMTGALKGRLEPQDVVQEVWCRALARFQTFRAGQVRFRAWVFRIANLVLMEAYRRARGPRGREGAAAISFDDLADSATSIGTRLAEADRLQECVQRLRDLDEDDLRLLLFAGLEGLPHAETAERLGIAEGAVRKRWQRLKERLDREGLPEGLLEPEQFRSK